MESANAIINTAIDALRGEAEAIQAKIEALESSLSLDSESDGATPAKPKSRKGRPKKVQAELELTPQKKTRGRPKKTVTEEGTAPKTRGRPKKVVEAVEESAPKDKVKAAAEKRSKSWDDSKKKAAAERMRKYWADRKKANG